MKAPQWATLLERWPSCHTRLHQEEGTEEEVRDTEEDGATRGPEKLH